MILKGTKIYLKKGLSDKGYFSLLNWFHDLEVIRYLNFAKEALKFNTIRDVKSFLKKPKNNIIFGIYANNGKLIGYSDIFNASNKSCWFGIIVGDKDYWGKGIGTETTRLIIDYAFNKLGMKKIVLTTTEHNKNAVKLYKKIGFKIVKKVPKDRYVFLRNKWVRGDSIRMELNKNMRERL